MATAATGVREAMDPRLLLELLRTGAFRLALLGNLLGFGLHVAALQSLPLFLVQAVISGSVAVTAVLSVRILRDALTRLQKAAIAGVCLGLALLATAAGEGAAHGVSDRLVPGLVAVLGCVALVGAVVGRVSSRWTSVALGLLSGTAFAVVAVGARILPDLAPATVVRTPAAYLMAGAGVIAFLLYANAMQRGSVTRSTAAMVVTQTAVPAGVGIALLGDRVRDGFAAVGVLGLLLSLAAVAVLTLTTRPETAAAELLAEVEQERRAGA
jgi:drug/metabolite transporter (DMT)-like permease